MKQKNYRGQWAGCSNLTEKREELLKAHQEFQQMLADGYQIKSAKKVKRPRIKTDKQPKQVVVTLGGTWTLTLDFEEYKKRGDGLKIVMKIY